MNRYLITAAALTAALACLLTGCKKDDEAAPPTEYAIGEETVAALTTEEDAEVTQETGEEGETTYIYDGLADSGAAVGDYIAQLTAEEVGFSVVDEEYVRTEAPNLTAEEGTVWLARDAQEDGSVLSIQLDWAEGQCSVKAVTLEGAVTEAEEPAAEGMTLLEAVDYFNSLHPSALGLEGESMEEYNIYALGGIVFVDGQPCLHLSVYSASNEAQSNDLMGNYLITSDKVHLYFWDKVTGTVKELV